MTAEGSIVSEDRDSGGTPIRLGEALIAKGVLTPQHLAEALAMQYVDGRMLGEVLVDLGYVDERALAEALALQSGCAFEDLAGVRPEPEVVAALPESVVRAHLAMPIRTGEGGLVVAVAHPGPALQHTLEVAAGGPVTLVAAPATAVRRLINAHYKSLALVARQVDAFSAAAASRQPRDAAAAITSVGPVVQVVDLLLAQAVRDRASDVHLEPQETTLRVRYRIDGALHDVATLPLHMAPAIVSRVKVMSHLDIGERRRPQDGQLTVDVDGESVDIRVSVLPTTYGEKIAMRILAKDTMLFSLRRLGMPDEVRRTFERQIRLPYGMVVCSGPTGSGKTTTLYAALNSLDSTALNISTIEDPVEYVFPGLNQVSVKPSAGLTFASGLRSLLRQDPDAILVGEMRDEETARIATQASLTGRLVLTSLHAIDSASSLLRIVNMGVERFLVTASVSTVVAQRLTRMTCHACREPYVPTAEELVFVERLGCGEPEGGFTRGVGCDACGGTGFYGRTGVFEIFVLDDGIRFMIEEGAGVDDLRRAAVEHGYPTLRESAADLVRRGVTTASEVARTVWTGGS